MGYTHYWSVPKDNISDRTFNKLLKDMKTIEAYFNDNEIVSTNAGGFYSEKERTPVVLCTGSGEEKGVYYGLGEIEDKQKYDYFSFNGDNREGLGLNHETFSISRGYNYSSFCKTARKPYDVAVGIMLLCLKYHLKGSRISSDGDIEEWLHSIQLFHTIFPDRKVLFGGLVWKGDDSKNDGTLTMLTDSTAGGTLGFTNGEIEVLVTIYKKSPEKFMQIVKKYEGKADEIIELVQQRVRVEVGV